MDPAASNTAAAVLNCWGYEEVIQPSSSLLLATVSTTQTRNSIVADSTALDGIPSIDSGTQVLTFVTYVKKIKPLIEYC